MCRGKNLNCVTLRIRTKLQSILNLNCQLVCNSLSCGRLLTGVRTRWLPVLSARRLVAVLHLVSESKNQITAITTTPSFNQFPQAKSTLLLIGLCMFLTTHPLQSSFLRFLYMGLWLIVIEFSYLVYMPKEAVNILTCRFA